MQMNCARTLQLRVTRYETVNEEIALEPFRCAPMEFRTHRGRAASAFLAPGGGGGTGVQCARKEHPVPVRVRHTKEEVVCEPSPCALIGFGARAHPPTHPS